MEWFYYQRAYPLKHVPAGARLKALKQLDEMLAAEAQSTQMVSADVSPEIAFDLSSSAISSTRWTLIGPEPTDTPFVPVVAGRVTALGVDPTNSSMVYAGAADGGIWKTTDGGVHWTPLTDAQPSLAVGSIAIDPSNHSTIYVGTGEENFSGDSYYGAGILKSTNGGTSWTQIKGPFVGPFSSDGYFGGGARVGAIAVEPGNSSVILAAVELFSSNRTGVYRTEDGGTTWTNVLSGAHGTAVMFDPTNGNVAYAALGDIFGNANNGVYKSLDGGKTWTATPLNVAKLGNVGRIALALAPSSSARLYAGVATPYSFQTGSSALLGMFVSSDGGAHWMRLTTPDYCTPQCHYDHAIGVQPNNANVVFVGGAFGGGTANLYRSTDGGVNWTNVTQGADGFFLHADLHALAFSSDSSILYLGNDGGVWSASAPTATPVPWTELNNALAITQFYFSPSINPKDVTNSFGGTQDNGTQKYSGVLTWNDVVCGDGGWTAMDPVTPSNVYSSCPRVNGLVWKSTAGGVFGSWSLAVTGINLNDRMQFYPPLTIDPLHPANLYLGTYRVYQTTNNADNWTAIPGNLTGNAGTLTTIAVAPTNSNTVYVGTSNSLVQVTTNALAGAGAVWNNRSAGLPPRFVTQVAVDPHSSTTAYVAFSGFSGFVDNLGHVFRTTDGGTTWKWKDISGNLPNIPVNGIAIDSALANTYYVATDIGVFRTRNGGGSWSALGAGLPRVTVLGLTLHNPSRTLRAATHGRSMWDIHVPIADLAISATETPNPVPDGTNLTYILTVTNKGPDIATNTVVSDATPMGTAFVGFTTGAGTCTAPAVGATGTLSCKVGSLASGAKVTVTMTVMDTAAAGSTLKDTGKASSATPDPNTKNNSVTVNTSVGPELPGTISSPAGHGSGCSQETDSVGDGCPSSNAILNQPSGTALDSSGNIFICDAMNQRIRVVNTQASSITIAGVQVPPGVIATVAGTGSSGFSGDGGLGVGAQINTPAHIAFHGSRYLYIADTGNERIRRLDVVSGIITTVAGNGSAGYSGDGAPAINAELNFPEGIGFDAAGNILFADFSNERIRRINAVTGIITTVAGNGSAGYSGDGGLAINAQLNGPSRVAIDSSGNLFISDFYNNRLRKVDGSGVISTVAGDGFGGYSGDGGPAINAQLNGPLSVTVDLAGNLFVADYYNQRVRAINSQATAITINGISVQPGDIATIAGNGSAGYSGDGGPATAAQINGPTGIILDSIGDVYFAEINNNVLRKVSGP